MLCQGQCLGAVPPEQPQKTPSRLSLEAQRGLVATTQGCTKAPGSFACSRLICL